MISSNFNAIRQMFVLSCIVTLNLIVTISIKGAESFSRDYIVSGLNACRVDINTGRIHFKETQKYYPRLSEEETQEKIKKQIDFLNIQWEGHKKLGSTQHVDRFFERDIAGAPYYVRAAHAPEDRQEEATCLFQILERNQDGTTQQYRYKTRIKNTLMRDLLSERYKYVAYDYSAVCGFDGSNLTEIVHREFTDPEYKAMDFATIYPRYSQGDFEYSGLESYGRCPYKVPDDAKLIGIESKFGEQVYILQFVLSSGGMKKIWVDPAKGFSVLRSETYNRDGLLCYFFEFNDPAKFGQTWYPRKIRSVTLKRPIRQDETISGNIWVDLTREVLEANFNIEIVPEEITVEVPAGISVTDFNSNPPLTYTLDPLLLGK